MNSGKWVMWLPSISTDSIRLGSVALDHKNGLAGAKLALGTDSWSISTGSSRMLSVPTEGCHMGHSREFIGTLYITYGQANMPNSFL